MSKDNVRLVPLRIARRKAAAWFAKVQESMTPEEIKAAHMSKGEILRLIREGPRNHRDYLDFLEYQQWQADQEEMAERDERERPAGAAERNIAR